MNFVLIRFLAKLAVGIFLLVAQAVLFQSQEWQKNEKSWSKFNFPPGLTIHKKIAIMDMVEDNQSVQNDKGLQQRRSYNSLVEQEQIEVPQAVEMCRTGSSQSSLKSEKSVSSLKSESSVVKESLVKKIPGQPNNFGTVVPGVYRSSYPQEADYPFLQKLGLKTIVTLVDKEMPETFLPFMKANGIQHRHITMEGTKKQAISVQTMSTILEVIHDKKNHPLLIHCNQGRHRTGCVVAITRKVQKWNADRILDEYKTYASPKIRDGDVEYISNFQPTDIEHLRLIPLVEALPVGPLHRPRRLYVIAVMIILMFLSISDIMRQPGSNKRPDPSLGL